MRHLLVVIVALILSSTLHAQVRMNLNVDVDRQPIWGPTGYDHVEYYYMPDIDVYYNVPQQRFFYYEGGRWISNSSLPSRYGGYDLYNSHKVVVNERTPYLNHKQYKDKFSSYKGRHDQQPIRDSRDARYFANQNHPEHNTWVRQQGHDNGNGNGRGNGRDKKSGRE